MTKSLQYLVLCLLIVFLAGCPRPQSGTPAEEEAQEERMRAFLNDSSPRNMNQQPKATPEFRKSFNVEGSSQDQSHEHKASGEDKATEVEAPY